MSGRSMLASRQRPRSRLDSRRPAAVRSYRMLPPKPPVTTRSAVATDPPSQYRTILADPPWDISQNRGGRGVDRHYPLMQFDRIAELPVTQLAATDAHLWLWTTNASMPDALELFRAWDFTFRSVLTWIKPRFGMGQYLRTQTEHVLLGTRGKAPMQFRGQGSWFYAPLQDHSHKPEEQYAIIERCSPGPCLELFARRPRLGWHVWGNEVDCDVAL